MKALFSGIAIAAVIGLWAGATMKPTLALSDGPRGPQIEMPASGERAQHDFEGGLQTWNGPVPDYVIGTDALKANAPAPAAPDEAYQAAYIPPDDPPPRYEFAAYEPPAPVKVSIPSIDGNTLAGLGPPPPAPEPEAPPPEG
ncbi:MAG: hypothetical protein Q8M88_04930 [Phenylobacterium sp.]|uniref:hypothetical protein n=1 Tax=Phenylobacterium sp. TaxID=1871053 RepID=UPI0027370951|nr:hypothetical protein [Phenylobacterium sp.]MDP3173758.1 hypothetical protein [Phenylobacterium sp.]